MQFKFKSLIEVVRYFKDEKTCYDFLESQIWHNGQAACPHCGSLHVYTRSNRSKNPAKQGVREYKCAEKGCNKNFTATVGTIFESSKLPLQTWFAAIWLCTTSSKGISSANLAKQLSITQKSAWFVLSRIREMFAETAPNMLDGMVEADETFVGGKNKNRHADKKKPYISGRSTVDKTPVVGMVQRDGSIRTFVTGDTTPDTLQGIIRNNVAKGAMVVTDAYGSYKGLANDYDHKVVKHSDGNYKTEGIFHTNNIEGFWGILKRGIIGVYHQTSRKHLQRYCDEFSYRYNHRNVASVEKFATALQSVVGARITYRRLIEKN